VVPWPFTNVDASVALAVHLGTFGLRAGWRVLYLNDRGVVDGTPHGDFFNGPTIACSIAF
jgi:hypothetical protein